MVVTLKIDSKRDYNNLYWSLRKAGLLSSVSVNDATLPDSRFPLEIPVEIDGLLALASHPLARNYKKIIDTKLSEAVKQIKQQMA